MKLISLTFDDGPNTVTTPQVLDLLEEYGIAASFFLIADRIDPDSAAVVRRALRLGCEIENHSTTHSMMAGMTPDQIRREVDHCTQMIVDITGRPPRFFRPPYIDVSRTLFNEIRLTFISGTGCKDWMPETTAEERIEIMLDNAKDGEIFLLHDMTGNDNTVTALKTVIPELKKRGFGFVTCGQLFDRYGITPKHEYLYSNVFQTETQNKL